jgi:hypothetical protein
MSAETHPRVPRFLKRTRVRSIMIVLILLCSILLTVSAATTSLSLKTAAKFNQQTLPLSRTYPYLAYDEQAGVTFTPDFTSLAFNVSAVSQTGPDGVGPAYLLNGLTNAGYWYQVGLSWKWPSTNGAPLPGFNMNYEVFDQFGSSVFPINGGGGVDNIRVGSGDLVLLSLSFSGTDVVMRATDWNTTSTATQYYPAVGASYFVGLPNAVSSNGFFTGLMTEEYHSAPYYGSGEPVVYQPNGLNISSAWVWADEFNTNTFQSVFSDATTSPIGLGNASVLQYFAFHGTAEAISAREFITGLSPIKFPILEASTSLSHHTGEQVTITITLQNPNSLAIRVKSLIISTQFGVFDVSSSSPSTPIIGNATLTASITIPAGVVTGNYTLTTVVDWHFDPQLKDWIAPNPLQANTTITISGTGAPSTRPPSTPPPSTPPPSTATTIPNPLLTLLRTVLPPALLAYAIGATLVVALVLRKQRTQPTPGPFLTHIACIACGNAITQTMLFCPNCGSSLTSPSEHGSVSASPQPPSPP